MLVLVADCNEVMFSPCVAGSVQHLQDSPEPLASTFRVGTYLYFRLRDAFASVRLAWGDIDEVSPQ